jgi:hypothetical protein
VQCSTRTDQEESREFDPVELSTFRLHQEFSERPVEMGEIEKESMR